ncbi:methylthioribulose 1-phosphate dehydratase [Aeoliella mucimassa]|uniref:Methylthioribulose-1-phosphate dehydratase n=1 Tax=Aeoliella mucimassa TaxID=2527972 RepID=A0A518AKX1_9BACT|nr:methylthioribulose 1-phosphate dehydratase [Aeoliella mucimassa]QDU55370.1 Methylthioribulose-1-phosphate dehydratase [Aeoliella mucimassa]
MSGRSTTIDIDPAEVERQLQANAEMLRTQLDGLRETGNMLHARGWSLGTSSNYSVVLERGPLELLLTASGKDKGRLERTDFVRVNDRGQRIERPGDDFPAENKPSAETLLHVVLSELPDTGAVLHTHSVWGTLLSDRFFEQGYVEISGFEMLKGLEGIPTHETTKRVTIFENTQDIASLAAEVRERLRDAENPLEHGFLIRKHGLYTWGRDLAAARRHIEVFEFLFECVGRLEFSAKS